MQADSQSQSIDVEGRRLGWRRTGDGPPLLLINGYAATAVDWDPAALAGLATAFTVICPDNRGVGASKLGDPAALTVDAMAEDLEALLDALELERLPVAGWWMGGFVAQRLAKRFSGGGHAFMAQEPQRLADLVAHFLLGTRER